MGFFDFLKRKKKSSARITVTEENVILIDDVEVWETIAYAWLCDSNDDFEREILWERFVLAYPEHRKKSCHEFWKRIHTTEWYHKNRHRHHHHGYDYC